MNDMCLTLPGCEAGEVRPEAPEVEGGTRRSMMVTMARMARVASRRVATLMLQSLLLLLRVCSEVW